MAGYNMPDVKSARLIHIDELTHWRPDDVHGNAVRILGRVVSVDAVASTLHIEYHSHRLRVCYELLDVETRTPFRLGSLVQFLGQLEEEKENGEEAGEGQGDDKIAKFVLKARLCQNMDGIDPDMYDRCLRIRRDFEQRLLNRQKIDIQ